MMDEQMSSASEFQQVGQVTAEEVSKLVGMCGLKASGELVILELADGLPLTTPILILTGAADSGPTVFIGGGAHGDEYNGMEIVRQVACQISPQSLRGQLVVIPIQNRLAFLGYQRTTPQQPFDNDLNRQFPGDASGWPTDRIANIIFNSFVASAGLVIDLHAATTGAFYTPTSYLPSGSPVLEHSRRLAAAFGVSAIIETPLTGTLLAAAAQAGIPGIIVELGAGGRLDERLITQGVEGVLNVLRAFGVLDGVVQMRPNPPIASKIHPVRTNHGGFVYAASVVGECVNQGSTLARVIRIPDREEVVRAPISGLVVRLTTHAVVLPGSPIALIVEVE